MKNRYCMRLAAAWLVLLSVLFSTQASSASLNRTGSENCVPGDPETWQKCPLDNKLIREGFFEEKYKEYSREHFLTTILEGPVKDCSMSIEAPAIAGNGTVVPFTVSLESPLLPGESLSVYVNHSFLAYTAKVGGETRLTMLSGRLKMPSGLSSILAVVRRLNGQVIVAEKVVRVTSGDESFVEPPVDAHVPSFKQVALDRGKAIEVKALIAYPSSLERFAKTFEADFSAGSAIVFLTPVASYDTFVGINVNRLVRPEYEVSVTDNSGVASTIKDILREN